MRAGTDCVITRIAGQNIVLAMAFLLLAGCTTTRNTSPAHSAKEELVINTAADRAAEALAAQVPPNLTAWIDSSGMSIRDDRNSAYALATIQDALLRHGVRLVERNRFLASCWLMVEPPATI